MSGLSKEVVLTGDFVTNTYVYLFKVAKNAYEEACESEKGQLYNLMITYVFLAFAFEAYINHVGEKKIVDWAKKERRMSQKERRDFIFSEIGIEPEYGTRPFQTLEKLFWFRDSLAHARTETIIRHREKEIIDWENPDTQDLFKTEWQEYCDKDNAEIAVNDIKEIISLMGPTIGESKPLSSLGRGSMLLERKDI